MVLPRLMVLKSKYNKKFLRYQNEETKQHRFLQFSEEEIVSPYAKFEVEMSKSMEGLVHIRSCYNNKYWVRNSPQDYWIVAGADEPVEDRSQWSCTLFQPIYESGDAGTLRLRHVQLGNNTCLWRTGTSTDSCIIAAYATADRDGCDLYTSIDWESLLILPKHVAFKGDNGRYLTARMIERHPYLQFESLDIGDPRVGHEVFNTRDGRVRIKSDYFGKFWRRSPNWIWADSNDQTTNNPDTLFWPVKVDKNVIALCNLGNRNFCKRLTTEGKTSCLNAAVPTITIEARLEVHELVMSREIYNVRYHLNDARVYNQRTLTMRSPDAVNNTNQQNSQDVKLSHTYTVTRFWSASVSSKLGVKTTFRTGVPVIARGEIKVSAEKTGAYQWGEAKTETSTMEVTSKVTLLPMSRARVNLLATEATWDIPFSYSQRDILYNGDRVTHDMDDGIYTGNHYFNIMTEIEAI